MRTLATVAALAIRGLGLLLQQLERQAQEQHAQQTTRAIPLAKKTVVMVVDDLTGDTLPENQGQTVRFALDGQDYEIDLSAEHATEFRDAVRKYINAGRRVSHAPQRRETRGRSTAPATPGSPPGRDTGAIREWARAHGYQVSDRGRLPLTVLEAYAARR
jgi:hypothetical protein